MILTRFKSAFTLIELLIVVAIIAILAAIAVPNFLEAQVRAKISRVRADHRSILTGLETYRIDYNTYPLMNLPNFAIPPDSKAGVGQYQRTLERLTSPISYLNGRSTFSDPFPGKGTRRLGDPTIRDANATTGMTPEEAKKGFSEYFYAVRGTFGTNPNSQQLQWGDDPGKVQWGMLQSSGPRAVKWYFGSEINSILASDNTNTRGVCNDILYNATNGTTSEGTILRAFGQPTGRGAVLGKVVMGDSN